MKKNFLYIAAALLLTACSENSTLDMAGMFSPNGEVVNTRFEQSMAYNQTRGEISLNMGADDYVIYVCTDSHITRKTHKNLDYFVAQYKAETAPKIAIHLGDVIDAQKNLPCADSILHFPGQTIADTVFVTPGNHDIYFKQWSEYRGFFKSGTYWFETRNGAKKLDLFICLDSADGTLGPKQTKWLRDLLANRAKAGYRRIIVFTHTHLFKQDNSQGHTSNLAIEETYELTSVLSSAGVDLYLAGHDHSREVTDYGKVRYITVDSSTDAEPEPYYMEMEIGEEIRYRFVSLLPLK